MDVFITESLALTKLIRDQLFITQGDLKMFMKSIVALSIIATVSVANASIADNAKLPNCSQSVTAISNAATGYCTNNNGVMPMALKGQVCKQDSMPTTITSGGFDEKRSMDVRIEAETTANGFVKVKCYERPVTQSNWSERVVKK
jgi:hypothetical protein